MSQHFCKLYGTSAQITTDYTPYTKYLNMLLSNVAIGSSGTNDVQIDVSAQWHQEWWGKNKLPIYSNELNAQVGSRFFMNKGRVRWYKKLGSRRLLMDMRFDEEKKFLSVSSLFQKKEPRDSLRYKFTGKCEESAFFELTYYLVYFPLFWYLEAYKNVHPLHASAVQLGDRSFVFAGFEGVGKTTLALALVEYAKAKLLSDNLVLYGNNAITACPEALRIYRKSKLRLAQSQIKLINHFHADKDFYAIQSQETNPLPLGAIFIPRFSSDSGLKPISPQECTDTLLNINEMTGEMQHYSDFFSAASIMLPKEGLRETRRRDLLKILENTNCYFLDIDKSQSLKGQLENVVELCAKVRV